MALLSIGQLQGLYHSFILALGGSSEEATTFAELLSIADLRGMDWQGIKSLHKHYVLPIQEGIIRLGETLEILGENSGCVTLDAHGELGQVCCKRAMEMAIAKAQEAGSCVVVVRHAGDTGLLASYTTMALGEKCIGIMWNTTNAYVAPWGGRERRQGIPPLSMAIPARHAYPVLVDTTLTEAKPFYDHDHMWQPPFPPPPLIHFQSHREYAASAALELICGALADMPLGLDKTRRGECAAFLLAIHIPHFGNFEDFVRRVDRYVQQVKTAASADGATEVLLPGERGFREQERRQKEGIPVPDDVWARIVQLGTAVGVDFEEIESI